MGQSKGFFETKRPWSPIKDRVLSHYLPGYLAKVAHLNKRILLVDAFAGAGMFEDGTPGSPLLICEQAEKYVPNQYQAIFVNRDRKHHEQLEAILRSKGYNKSAQTIMGDAHDLLRALPDRVGNLPLFLYLDPFGLIDCSFDLLEPFLSRDQHLSTEILFLLHMPITHRLAMSRQVAQGKPNPKVAPKFHDTLTRIFGGAYWQEALWNSELSPEERERQLVQMYVSRLRAYLPQVHSCPVRESPEARVKYYLVFASRHRDAVALMNEAMATAYHGHMHRAQHHGSLWESADWRQMRQVDNFDDNLEERLLEIVRAKANWIRDDLIQEAIEQNFMLYTRSEYITALRTLKEQGKIEYDPDPRTKRLNSNSHVSLRNG